MDLTTRQKQLLKAIIEVHVKNGESVGSETIEKEINLGVSPATIRNEMVKLTELGFLKQLHTSAGRVPTSMGFRIYIQELMKEKELPVSAEVSMKQDMWQKRHTSNLLVKEAVRSLASKLSMLALAVNEDDEVLFSGAYHILDYPEFEDIDVTRFVLSLFDENPRLREIIGRALGPDPMHVLFGDELGFEDLIPTGFVFCKFVGVGAGGVIGVIGPARMDFPVILPYVRYASSLIDQAIKSY